jgi:cytochrome c-type biogenesis protein CcmH/NrfG
MRSESIVFAVSGILFGLIAGWILGSQQASGRTPVAAAAAPPAASAPAANTTQPAVLDENKAQALRTVAEQNPNDEKTRIDLGNLYFDAERYDDAITWYEAALKINPKDPNVSTDLGVAYYYMNQADRAIKQFEHSLSMDAKHTKTLLNMGIVKAFGKQDLAGATEAWQQVVAVAPNSPEGQAAKKALDGLQSAHPTGAAGSGGR